MYLSVLCCSQLWSKRGEASWWALYWKRVCCCGCQTSMRSCQQTTQLACARGRCDGCGLQSVMLVQAVEQARRGKLVGASLEARVLLWLSDEGLRDAVSGVNAAHNGIDPLRYLFITSQVLPW